MKKASDSSESVSGRSTLTFEEIMEILEEELAKCQLEDNDKDFAPLNFDGEANRK